MYYPPVQGSNYPNVVSPRSPVPPPISSGTYGYGYGVGVGGVGVGVGGVAIGIPSSTSSTSPYSYAYSDQPPPAGLSPPPLPFRNIPSQPSTTNYIGTAPVAYNYPNNTPTPITTAQQPYNMNYYPSNTPTTTATTTPITTPITTTAQQPYNMNYYPNNTSTPTTATTTTPITTTAQQPYNMNYYPNNTPTPTPTATTTPITTTAQYPYNMNYTNNTPTPTPTTTATPTPITTPITTPTTSYTTPISTDTLINTNYNMDNTNTNTNTNTNINFTNQNHPSSSLIGTTDPSFNQNQIAARELTRFTPPFRRFKYHFFWKDDSSRQILYDLQSSHKLNKAMERNQKTAKLTIKGRSYIVDFEKMKQIPDTPDSPNKKDREIFKSERSRLWFYRDHEQKIVQYDLDTNNKINNSEQPRVFSTKIGKHEYDINLTTKIQTNKKTKKERDIFSEEDLNAMRSWPIEFENVPKPDEHHPFTITPLSSDSEEFKRVADYFYMHMPREERVKTFTGKITRKRYNIKKVEKINNPRLRKQWEFLLRKIREDNNHNAEMTYTKLLWHGSGDLSPNVIYTDVHYGWKINYASDKNLWGRGLYFGEDASYCHKYTYKTTSGSRQVFLAEVITGDDIISLEDSTIKEPWEKEEGKVRYDSVCGVRHETSWIWVVYASGRAYPTYLVEYDE